MGSTLSGQKRANKTEDFESDDDVSSDGEEGSLQGSGRESDYYGDTSGTNDESYEEDDDDGNDEDSQSTSGVSEESNDCRFEEQIPQHVNEIERNLGEGQNNVDGETLTAVAKNLAQNLLSPHSGEEKANDAPQSVLGVEKSSEKKTDGKELHIVFQKSFKMAETEYRGSSGNEGEVGIHPKELIKKGIVENGKKGELSRRLFSEAENKRVQKVVDEAKTEKFEVLADFRGHVSESPNLSLSSGLKSVSTKFGHFVFASNEDIASGSIWQAPFCPSLFVLKTASGDAVARLMANVQVLNDIGLLHSNKGASSTKVLDDSSHARNSESGRWFQIVKMLDEATDVAKNKQARSVPRAGAKTWRPSPPAAKKRLARSWSLSSCRGVETLPPNFANESHDSADEEEDDEEGGGRGTCVNGVSLDRRRYRQMPTLVEIDRNDTSSEEVNMEICRDYLEVFAGTLEKLCAATSDLLQVLDVKGQQKPKAKRCRRWKRNRDMPTSGCSDYACESFEEPRNKARKIILETTAFNELFATAAAGRHSKDSTCVECKVESGCSDKMQKDKEKDNGNEIEENKGQVESKRNCHANRRLETRNGTRAKVEGKRRLVRRSKCQ